MKTFEPIGEKKQTKKSQDFSCDGLSNTRRGTQFKFNLSFCIDYFKFRVDGNIDIPKTREDYLYDENGDYSFIMELCKILLVNPFERLDEKKGFQRYNFFSTFDEDVTVFGGRASENADDGTPRCYVELKGHALRMFELRCIENNVDVFEQYKKLFEFCYKYTNPSYDRNLRMLRIDTTIDDYSNYITIKEIQDKLRNGFYVSKCRTERQNLDYKKNIVDDNDQIKEISKNDGWTFYIGGKTSRQLCIYDKKAEREEKGNVVTVDTWLRYEGRFYQNNAHAAFLTLFKEVYYPGLKEKFNATIGFLIGQIVEFKEDNNLDANHQYMADTWSKWTELLDCIVECGFAVQADKEKDITFRRAKNWLIKTPYMNITLEFLVESNFEYNSFNHIISKNNSIPKLYDLTGIYFDDNFIKFILQLLIKGKKKLDNQKLSIVNNMRSAKGLEKIKCVVDAQLLIDAYVDNRGSFGFDDEIVEDDE